MPAASEERPGPRRVGSLFHAGALLVLLLATAVGATGAVAQEERPEGMWLGPWVIAPGLVVGYARDSNVFYQSSSGGSRVPASDSLVRIRTGLDATLLFRNSHLKLGSARTFHRYGRAPLVGRKWSQEIRSELSLLFGTQDRLTFGAERTYGLEETRTFDPGGEAVFEGSPYRLDELSLELRRDRYGARAYTVSVSGFDLDFDRGATVSFFEYRGHEIRAEYLEPVSSRLWVLMAYRARRFDHFRTSSRASMDGLFRREKSDVVLTGFRGRLGPKAPWSVEVGRAISRFTRGRPVEFRKIVWEANAVVPVGAESRVRLWTTRRALPSFFLTGDETFANDYYVFDDLGARFERHWRTGTTAGVEASLSRSRYPNPVPELPGSSTTVFRHDRTIQAEIFGDLAIGERVFLRLSVIRRRRDSNFEAADFRKTVALAGIGLGWF